jgi:hypothetical protein
MLYHNAGRINAQLDQKVAESRSTGLHPLSIYRYVHRSLRKSLDPLGGSLVLIF